jgi:hypothetical protein
VRKPVAGAPGGGAAGFPAAPPQQVGSNSRERHPGRELDLSPGCLLAGTFQGSAGQVAWADPLGERVDRAGEVLAGALDLLDQGIRIPHRDLPVRFSHRVHPFRRLAAQTPARAAQPSARRR